MDIETALWYVRDYINKTPKTEYTMAMAKLVEEYHIQKNKNKEEVEKK